MGMIENILKTTGGRSGGGLEQNQNSHYGDKAFNGITWAVSTTDSMLSPGFARRLHCPPTAHTTLARLLLRPQPMLILHVKTQE